MVWDNSNVKSNDIERLNWEKEVLGLFVSDHPLKGMENFFNKKGTLIAKLLKRGPVMPKNPIKVGGIVNSYRKLMTKKKDQMAIVTLEDPTGKMEVVIFPKTFAEYSFAFDNLNGVFFVEGRWDKKDGDVQVLASRISRYDLQVARNESRKLPRLRFKNEKMKSPINSATQQNSKICAVDHGIPSLQNNVWKIKIPEGVTKEALGNMGTILKQSPGNNHVQIIMSGKVHDLPYQVRFSEDLRSKVEEIFRK